MNLRRDFPRHQSEQVFQVAGIPTKFNLKKKADFIRVTVQRGMRSKESD
jgi:hypothetical protein